jgi:hypothetical protein
VTNKIAIILIVVMTVLLGDDFLPGPAAAPSPNAPLQAASLAPSTTSSSLEPREAARRELDTLYKGDYRRAFLEKRPELFLKHIAPKFHSTAIDGTEYDAPALRRFFPQQFANMVRVHEHNVTIEDVDVAADGAIAAVVTLTTLIEYKGAKGRTYFVTSIGTYHDHFIRSPEGILMETGGDQLRSQTITWPSP